MNRRGSSTARCCKVHLRPWILSTTIQTPNPKLPKRYTYVRTPKGGSTSSTALVSRRGRISLSVRRDRRSARCVVALFLCCVRNVFSDYQAAFHTMSMTTQNRTFRRTSALKWFGLPLYVQLEGREIRTACWSGPTFA